MKLIEYKRPQFVRGGDLELIGEINMSKVRMNRVYQGEMSLINQINLGMSIKII